MENALVLRCHNRFRLVHRFQHLDMHLHIQISASTQLQWSWKKQMIYMLHYFQRERKSDYGYIEEALPTSTIRYMLQSYFPGSHP